MATKKKPTQLDRIERSLDGIAEEIKFLKALNVVSDNHSSPESLRPGDYTDASKETADALTAMGFKWYDTDRFTLRYIAFGSHKDHEGMILNRDGAMGKDTLCSHAEFLSRASVTAKEIGLVPVVEAIKVGDLVEVIGPAGLHGNDRHRGVVDTAKEWKTFCTDKPTFYLPKVDCWYEAPSLRKLSDAEVQQHLAEQEARANAEKIAKLKFGVRVNANRGDGVYWKKVNDDWHDIMFPDGWASCSTKELTVIDPQP